MRKITFILNLVLIKILFSSTAFAEDAVMSKTETCRDNKDFRKAVYTKLYYQEGISGRTNLYFFSCEESEKQFVCHSNVNDGPGSGSGDVEFYLGFKKDCSKVNFLSFIGAE